MKIKKQGAAKEVDLNLLAAKYTHAEGGKIQMSIGQTKELLKLILTDISQMDFASLSKLLSKVNKRYGGKA